MSKLIVAMHVALKAGVSNYCRHETSLPAIDALGGKKKRVRIVGNFEKIL